MWRAECGACDFTSVRLLREEAERDLSAHLAETGHIAWCLAPMSETSGPDPSPPEKEE